MKIQAPTSQDCPRYGKIYYLGGKYNCFWLCLGKIRIKSNTEYTGLIEVPYDNRTSDSAFFRAGKKGAHTFQYNPTFIVNIKSILLRKAVLDDTITINDYFSIHKAKQCYEYELNLENASDDSHTIGGIYYVPAFKRNMIILDKQNVPYILSGLVIDDDGTANKAFMLHDDCMVGMKFIKGLSRQDYLAAYQLYSTYDYDLVYKIDIND